MKTSYALWMIAALTLGSVACGGDDDSSSGAGSTSCSPVAACGGDITGSWKVSGVCVDQATLMDQAQQVCDNATLTLGQPKVTGSLTFASDGSYTQGASSASGSVVTTLGASCLKQGSDTLTCDQVEKAGAMTLGSATTKCVSTSDGGCKCTTNVDQTSMVPGTYTTSGNSLTLTPNNADAAMQDYCVQGNKLYILPNADSALPAQVQFEKQ